MAKKTRDKTPQVKTRRKHRQTTRKALAVPVAQFLVEILGMRKRFSIVSVKKGKNSTFSTVDMCLGILGILMLECDLSADRQVGLSTSIRNTNRSGCWRTNLG